MMEGKMKIKNRIRFFRIEIFCSDALFSAAFLLAINFVSTTLNNNFNYQSSSIL